MYIRKARSGTGWRVEVSHQDRRRSGTAATKKAAEALGRKLLSELEHGGADLDHTVTVGQLVDRRIDKADWAPVTRDSYQRAATRLGSLRNQRADTVTVATIEHRYAELVDQGVDVDSVRHLHSLLRQALNEGIRIGVIRTSPMDVVQRPTKPAERVAPPTPAQVAAMLAASTGPLHVALRLAAATGMRRGEVVGLRWEALDLDADGDHLTVDMSLAYTSDAGVHIRPTKTGQAGHRRLTLDHETIERLRAHRIDQVELAVALGAGTPTWVISDDAGRTPWRPDRLTREFATTARQVGVHGHHLHDLRHFHATRALAAGVSPRIVAHRLGHTDPATTEKVYAHWIPGLDAGVADIVGALLDAGSLNAGQ
jgi:integrase